MQHLLAARKPNRQQVPPRRAERRLKLRYHPLDTLPQLAWCARMTRGRDAVDVFHGRSVKWATDAFFEGAWNGVDARPLRGAI
jgi:hypothetical protein